MSEEKKKITRMEFKERIDRGMQEIRSACQKWGIDIAAKIETVKNDPLEQMVLKPTFLIVDSWKIQAEMEKKAREKAEAEKAAKKNPDVEKPKEEPNATSNNDSSPDQGKGPEQGS